MAAGPQALPHIYMDSQVKIGPVLALIEQTQATIPELTLLDVVVRASGIALTKVAGANSVYAGEGATRALESANVGLAIRTANGITVPIISGVDTTRLAELVALRTIIVSTQTGNGAEAAVSVTFAEGGAGVPAVAFRTVLPVCSLLSHFYLDFDVRYVFRTFTTFVVSRAGRHVRNCRRRRDQICRCR